MQKHKRTQQELREELHHQVAALRASCAGYDSGNNWEAPRLATVVYTLVNDGRSKSISILSQLGLRSQMDFVSYASPQVRGNLFSWAPLCMMRLANNEALHVPQLAEDPKGDRHMIKFKDWWSEAIFENSAGAQLNRMNLVFALRSQDGGSHFDAELPTSPYLEMKQDGLGFVFEDGNGTPPKKVGNAHVATMRQIAFELEQSLLPHL